MLKRRAVHNDMTDVNGYAAKRLKDMARSLGGLAKTFGKMKEEPGLTKEDGLAALEAASAMVCGSCTGCGIRSQCRSEEGEENYYLYYLLRTFEKKGNVIGLSGTIKPEPGAGDYESCVEEPVSGKPGCGRCPV